MEHNELYLFFIIILPTLFYFAHKRNKEGLKGANKRLRINIHLTVLLESITLGVFILALCNMESISIILAVDKGYIFIIGFIAYFIIFTLLLKLVYEPINKNQYKQEKLYRKNNRRNWKYYILEYPASSTSKMITLPPVSKYSKPSRHEIRKYHISSLDVAPIHIQWILIVIIFILTGFGFILSDFIMNEKAVIYVNLFVLPFFLLLIFWGNIIFKFLDFLEYFIGIKPNEKLKFLAFNVLFVLVIDLLWFFIIKGKLDQ
jgi:hypothetical protein